MPLPLDSLLSWARWVSLVRWSDSKAIPCTLLGDKAASFDTQFDIEHFNQRNDMFRRSWWEQGYG